MSGFPVGKAQTACYDCRNKQQAATWVTTATGGFSPAVTTEMHMGPQEKRLLSELAVYLVRNCSRALQDLPAGTTLDLADRRRWFVRAYHEWQLTPRVDLAGRSPYEVIAAERAAERSTLLRQMTKPAIELYTDLPTFDQAAPFAALHTDEHGAEPQTEAETPRADHDLSRGIVNHEGGGNWQRLADQLFGTWLDDKLDRL